MADVQTILDPAPMPRNVKADAFDAFTSSQSADDLQKRLDKLPLPAKVKADLWDLKNSEGGGAIAPAAKAPEGGGFFHNVGQFLGGVADVVNPLPALYDTAVKPVLDLARSVHGGDAAGALDAVRRFNPATAMGDQIVNASAEQGRRAADEFKQGHYIEAAGRAGAMLPIIGPAAAQAGELIGDGQTARGLGQAAGLIGSTVLPHAIKAGVDRGILPTGGQAVQGVRGAAGKVFDKVADQNPRPLSAGASAMADRLNVPLTRGMEGGSKTVRTVEKMLGHSVAPDLFEPILEQGRAGVTAGARDLAGGYAVDQFGAGQSTIDQMLESAQDHETTAQAEYDKLRAHEANPDNVRKVQVGMMENPTPDPGAPAMVPNLQPVALPTDMRPVKAAIAPYIAEVERYLPELARKSDPALAALKNIITRPDHLPASVAEADLGFLKDIQREDASPRAKRLATIAANALQPAVEDAVSAAGPEALESLRTARGSWAARSSILDDVKGLANDTTGRTGQVTLAQKLLQPADANYPMLQRVLMTSPDAAQQLGKAYLTEKVFGKQYGGADLVSPVQARNVWNHLGPRTKAALYTPEQITDLNHFFELAQRVAENPNPSETGIVNTLLKVGAMATHPVTGGLGLIAGRKLANLLYHPAGARTLAAAIAAPESAAASAVSRMMQEPPPIPNEQTTPNTAGTAGGSGVVAGTTQPRATLPEQVQPGGGDPGAIDGGAGGQVEPAAGGQGASGQGGNPQTLVTVPGDTRQYGGRYAVRELADVQASHNPFNFQPNPRYGLVNDRNYDNPVNQGKIVNWSAAGPGGFDPNELVNDARNSATGPPVIDSAGNVLGGNGRSMILQRVYKGNAAGASAYRDLLAQKAAQFGVDPADVAGMKQPALVRVIDDAEFSKPGATKQNAVTDFNKVGTASLTPSERAISDSRRVSTSTLDDISKRMDDIGPASTLAQTLEGRGGVEVLNNLISDGVISPQERGELANQNQLTKAGRDRIQALMTGRYFQTPAQMELAPPSIRNKVERMAAPLAHVEGNAAYNLSPVLQEAMGILEDANAHGATNIDDYLQQHGMFADQQFSRGAVALAKQLLHRDPTKLQAAARAYAEHAKYASEYQGPGMFNEFPDPVSPAEAFERHFGGQAVEDERRAKFAAKNGGGASRKE